MNKAERIIKGLESIEPMGQTAVRILEVMGDDDHGMQDVVRIAETDPPLTAEILRVVNTAYYSLRQQVTSLARAVSYLGDRVVALIAVKTCSGRLFSDPLAGYGAGQDELWRHSLCVAVAARELAGHSRGAVTPDSAFTAGVLHDIGKAAISEFLEGKTGEIVQAIENRNVEGYLAAERQYLGTDHCVVGEVLAQHWNLPAPLRSGILWHHDPSGADEEYLALAHVVHVADVLAMMAGRGTGADSLRYPLCETYKEYLAISENGLEKILLSTIEELRKMEELFFQ